MEHEGNHIVSYRKILLVLAGLIVLTLISVFVTAIHLGTFTVLVALLIASVKSSLVLGIFMHLKFDDRMFSLMVLGVILLLASVIFITLVDYLYR